MKRTKLIQCFRETAAEDAGGMANVGHGKLALVASERRANPLGRMSCREAQAAPIGEQGLLNHILEVARSSGYAFPRALIVNYYVSLKTNPFVILTGAEGRGKTELARMFAEALVGSDSPQYTLIPSAGAWPGGTGQDSYYRLLHERFSSWRFLDLLQEAALPSSCDKVYLICFDALHPDELEYYFATLLRIAPSGEKRLNLPGFPADRQPIIPPNVYITATVNTADRRDGLSRNVLCHAGLIEFRAPQWAPDQPALRARSLVPPSGFQRIWLGSSLHDLGLARARLAATLGDDAYGRLRCSTGLAQLLWRAGLALTKDTLQEIEIYVANSFDLAGRGLFDPANAQRNAQIAYDSQVAQRFLWRMRESPDLDTRRDLAEYLDHLALEGTQQAVA